MLLSPCAWTNMQILWNGSQHIIWEGWRLGDRGCFDFCCRQLDVSEPWHCGWYGGVASIAWGVGLRILLKSIPVVIESLTPPRWNQYLAVVSELDNCKTKFACCSTGNLVQIAESPQWLSGKIYPRVVPRILRFTLGISLGLRPREIPQSSPASEGGFRFTRG